MPTAVERFTLFHPLIYIVTLLVTGHNSRSFKESIIAESVQNASSEHGPIYHNEESEQVTYPLAQGYKTCESRWGYTCARQIFLLNFNTVI